MTNHADPLTLIESYRIDTPRIGDTGIAAARREFMDGIASQDQSRRSRPLRRGGRRSTRAVLVAVLATTFAVGSAVAAIDHFSNPSITIDGATDLGAIQHISDLEIFQLPSNVNFVESGDSEAIEKISSDLDLATARSVPIPGSEKVLWLIQTHDDELCIFSPANEGFNSACGGPQVINESGMFGVPSGVGDDPTIAISIAPNGESGLTVKSTDGSERTVNPFRDVNVAEVNETDLVTNGVVTINLAKMPTAGSQVGAPPPPKD